MVFAVTESARPLIFVLIRCTDKTYKTLVSDGKFATVIVKLLREIAYNLLHNTDLLLSKQQKGRLSHHKVLIRSLANRSAPIYEHTRIIAKNQRAIANTILEPFKNSLQDVF